MIISWIAALLIPTNAQERLVRGLSRLLVRPLGQTLSVDDSTHSGTTSTTTRTFSTVPPRKTDPLLNSKLFDVRLDSTFLKGLNVTEKLEKLTELLANQSEEVAKTANYSLPVRDVLHFLRGRVDPAFSDAAMPTLFPNQV
eukprot:Gregarina_sp_Poly_1__1133@NODE_1278_length_4511_cov_81_929118_g5_i1_p5_GENE_NODE_1278_length_4511_cov_81_929118_g5_i1NODE_1278_length_4511_cov_81_929118_g5_i1_p5_ORF_typecomplete_len141_score23_17_NODE_1278_length_4511_cov_81_929118_g5_i131603582